MGVAMSIQIYGFWRSIASFRVRVALRLKCLRFDETQIDIIFDPDKKEYSNEYGGDRRQDYYNGC